MSKDRIYLGDAVYAWFDGYYVWLVTNNGIRDYNVIALEPPVLENFQLFLRNLHAQVIAEEEFTKDHNTQ